MKISENYKILFLLFIVITLLRVIPYIRYAGTVFDTSWSVMRSYSIEISYSGINAILYYLYYCLGGVIVICWLRGDVLRLVISMIILIFDILVMRNRVEMLPLICSISFILMLNHENITLKTIVIGMFAVVFFIYIIYFVRALRWYGTIGDIIDQFSFKDLNEQV
ncbi:MAG: hypothetical protein AB7G87_13070, partial [Clostridia bacterium]